MRQEDQVFHNFCLLATPLDAVPLALGFGGKKRFSAQRLIARFSMVLLPVRQITLIVNIAIETAPELFQLSEIAGHGSTIITFVHSSSA